MKATSCALCVERDGLHVLMSAPIYAALKRHEPYLAIPGKTETPMRFHKSSGGARRQLKLAVACNSEGGMFIQELTGTKYNGYEQQSFEVQGPKGPKPASSMGSDEYLHFIQVAWKGFMQQPAFRCVAKGAVLIHDKSRIHTSKKVQKGLEDMGLAFMVQPARSPDLMPLDYGIFGTLKTKLARTPPQYKPWEEKVQLFKDLLLAFNPSATIAQFQSRIEKIIEKRGRHIESALKGR